MTKNFDELLNDMKNSTETALQYLDESYIDKTKGYCVNHDYHVHATNKLINILLEIDCLISGYGIEKGKNN